MEGLMEQGDSSVGDRPGAPTWPIPTPTSADEPAPPPVGLNWQVLAERLAVDRRVLEHDGVIVLAGEYFPEEGFFFDPSTLTAQPADVGDIALQHGYFLGDLAIRDFRVRIPLGRPTRLHGHPIIRHEAGTIIGLFPSEIETRRARQQILQGSLGSGLSQEAGPLGVELRVEHPELPGRVATVIAANGGAVISVSGKPVRTIRS
jgi:hypothetical protein